MKATYVTVWDSGEEIRTACEYNEDTRTVSNIEKGGSPKGACSREYIELEDGDEIERDDFLIEEEDEGNEKRARFAVAFEADCAPSELDEESTRYGLSCFSLGSKEWLVGTDEEADAAMVEYCRDTAWAFKADFILSECELPYELEEAIQSFQEEKCESANDAMVALIEKCCKGGMEEFAKSAASADGRGHFLSGYDGDENEHTVRWTTYYVYRVN